MREKSKMHERLRELTNQELSSLPPTPMGNPGQGEVPSGFGRSTMLREKPMTLSVRKRRMTESSADTSSSAPKSAKRGTARDCVTFKQLQDLVDDLKQEGRFVGELACPVCHAKRTGPSAFVRHLYFHLGTKGHHFYKCPFEDCGFRTVLIGNVKAHVLSRPHKAVWTEDMNDRCIVQNNFDAFNALCRQ